MQNTCMNFVVYWCIFLHIIMLLIVIIISYNVLWGFSIDPPYFGYNSAGQENPALRNFLVSRTFPDSNWPGIFRVLIFYHEKHLEKKKSTIQGPGAKQAQVVRAPCQAVPPNVVRTSSLQHCQSSPPNAQIDLKMPIYIPLWTITVRGGRETWNT
jgi:hypothetical protein